jgi:murein DD-endopeptidase MepM/ murein hydrolase activator NlpD
MQNDLKLVDSLHIKTKVNNIEDRLSRINDFLRERGVTVDSAAGGDVTDTLNLRIDPSVYEFYDNYTNSVFQDLKNIPVGFPYTGDVSSGYGNRRNPFGGRSGEFHSGIDLKGPIGDPIKATADGEVVNATWKGGYGICVVLDHGNGYQTYFGHLSGTNVMQGQKVKAGDVIGFLGSTGRSTGPHLHYEIRKDGVDINPLDYMYLN